jgi:hypothetical protein
VSVALVIQHAIRMCRVTFSNVASLAQSYYFTCSHKRHDFRERKILPNIKYAFCFSLQLLSETFLTLRRIQWEIIINVQSVCKLSAPYSCPFLIKFEFSRQFSKHPQIYRVIHKSVKHFKNSQQIDYATEHGNSYADRERNSPSFFLRKSPRT